MNNSRYGEPDFKYVWEKIKKGSTGSIDRNEIYQMVQQIISGLIPQVGDYNSLQNKPSIKGVTLIGNKSFEQLGLYEDEDDPEAVDLQRVTNTEIQAIVTFSPNI